MRDFRYLDRRGAYFGGVIGQPIGAGMIMDDVAVPFFDEQSNSFLKGLGLVCILTNECDIAAENNRSFNEKLLVAPIIDFQKWFQLEADDSGFDSAFRLARDAVADRIFRVLYLPTIPNTTFEYGGILYLNEITNAPIERVRNLAHPVCTLTSYSDRILRVKLENHLFRPKSSPLMSIN